MFAKKNEYVTASAIDINKNLMLSAVIHRQTFVDCTEHERCTACEL